MDRGLEYKPRAAGFRAYDSDYRLRSLQSRVRDLELRARVFRQSLVTTEEELQDARQELSRAKREHRYLCEMAKLGVVEVDRPATHQTREDGDG